jgi:hypothetical protein
MTFSMAYLTYTTVSCAEMLFVSIFGWIPKSSQVRRRWDSSMWTFLVKAEDVYYPIFAVINFPHYQTSVPLVFPHFLAEVSEFTKFQH